MNLNINEDERLFLELTTRTNLSHLENDLSRERHLIRKMRDYEPDLDKLKQRIHDLQLLLQKLENLR